MEEPHEARHEVARTRVAFDKLDGMKGDLATAVRREFAEGEPRHEHFAPHAAGLDHDRFFRNVGELSRQPDDHV